MKTRIKRCLAMLMALMMCLSLVQVTASAETGNTVASGTCGENLTWVLDREGTLLISGDGDMYDDWGRIDAPWYSYREDIKNIEFKGNVTSIGNSAFAGCDQLALLTIPDSVLEIGEWACLGCSNLTKVIIGDGVKELCAGVFLDSGIKEVILGKSVASLSIDSGDFHTFGDCHDLRNIFVDDDNLYFTSVDGVLFSKDKKTLVYCPNRTEYDIPKGTVTIGECSFNDCCLSRVTVPGTVTTIENHAFAGFTFSGELPMFEITIPSSVESMGEGCLGYFYYAGGQEYYFKKGVTIRGYNGTAAERYANENEFTFISLGDPPATPEVPDTPTDPPEPVVPEEPLTQFEIRYGLDETYAFRNLSDAIPKSLVEKFMGKAFASKFWSKGMGTHGQCYGMVVTAAASTVYKKPAADTYSSVWSNAEHLKDVKSGWSSWKTGMTASDYIKCGFIFQRSSVASYERKMNMNDLSGLYHAVEKYLLNQNEPVVLCIFGGEGGHALWPMGIGENTDSVTELIVYDCNWPQKERILYLYKDDGEYIGWEYELWEGCVWGSENGEGAISYEQIVDEFIDQFDANEGYVVPGYSKALFSSNRGTTITYELDHSVVLSPDSALPLDELLYIREVDVLQGATQAADKTDAYWVNIGDTITLQVPDEKSEYSFVAEESGIDVALPPNSVATLSVSGEDYNAAKLSMAENENFELAFYEVNESADVLQTIAISGESSETVTGEQTEDGIIVCAEHLNGLEVSLAYDDKMADTVTITSDKESILVVVSDHELLVYEDLDEDGTYENLTSGSADHDHDDPTTGSNNERPGSTEDPATGESPKTGDSSNVFWTALFCMAALNALHILLMSKRKARK